jgi:hypothetical protein
VFLSLGRDRRGYVLRLEKGFMMTTAPDEEPDQTPDEESPEEPGIGAQESRPVSEPDVEGDPDIAAPDPVEDA